MSEVRYYLDEHVSAAVAKGLRRRGIDVLTVPEARMRGEDDPDQFSLAKAQGRVFFTHDADYLRLAATGQTHAGLVFAPRQKSIGDVIRALLLIHQVLSEKDMNNKVEFI